MCHVHEEILLLGLFSKSKDLLIFIKEHISHTCLPFYNNISLADTCVTSVGLIYWSPNFFLYIFFILSLFPIITKKKKVQRIKFTPFDSWVIPFIFFQIDR